MASCAATWRSEGQMAGWGISVKAAILFSKRESVSLWGSDHRLGLVSSSSPTSSSYYDLTCPATDRLLRICEKHIGHFWPDLFFPWPCGMQKMHISCVLSLTGQSGSCVPKQCPRSSTLWWAAPPSGCRKPMRIGCGPSPPPLRNPPSWTDSSCFHRATPHTHAEQRSAPTSLSGAESSCVAR